MSVQLPRGAGGLFAPEFAVRATLSRGFMEFQGDTERQEQLSDNLVELYNAGADRDWIDDAVAQFVRWFDPNTAEILTMDIGYPWDAARLPYVSIVNQQGAGDAGAAVSADIQTRQRELVTEGGEIRCKEHLVYGEEWTTRIQVGSWTRAPVASLLLHSLVADVMFHGKGDLARAGVLEVNFSDSGITPDRQLYPETGYVPILICTLRWSRHTTSRRDVPYKYTLLDASVGT